MPANRSSRVSARVSPIVDDRLTCPQCQKTFGRTADARRHIRTHDPNVKKLKCTEGDCTYETYQASNLKTHMNTHNHIKPHKCLDDPECDFASADPASLTRHRRRKHGYKPVPRNGVRGKADVKKSRKGRSADDTIPAGAIEDASPLVPCTNAAAGPSRQPIPLEHQTVPTPSLPIASFSPSPSFSTCSSFSVSDSQAASDSTAYYYPPPLNYTDGYTYLGECIATASTSQTSPLPQVSPPLHEIEAEAPRLPGKDDDESEETPNIFTKNPSDLHYYSADSTSTGYPNAWIDAQDKASPDCDTQNFDLYLPRSPSPLACYSYQEDFDSCDRWLGYHTSVDDFLGEPQEGGQSPTWIPF